VIITLMRVFLEPERIHSNKFLDVCGNDVLKSLAMFTGDPAGSLLGRKGFVNPASPSDLEKLNEAGQVLPQRPKWRRFK
jgi:hypothetical protein